MLIAIFQHTPVWVWALLGGLVALGLSQVRSRDVSLTRVTILPMVLVALSAGGVLSAFGPSPLAAGAWLAGGAGVLAFGRPLTTVRGAAWSARTGMLHIPGSWWPLGLIVGLFAIKYTVGVALALNPGLATDPGFCSACALAYGLFAGVFFGRSLSLRRLAKPTGDLQTA